MKPSNLKLAAFVDNFVKTKGSLQGHHHVFWFKWIFSCLLCFPPSLPHLGELYNAHTDFLCDVPGGVGWDSDVNKESAFSSIAPFTDLPSKQFYNDNECFTNDIAFINTFTPQTLNWFPKSLWTICFSLLTTEWQKASKISCCFPGSNACVNKQITY